MIAALYVERGGVYWDLPDVDPWDQERDARQYAGPHPVVAHPPCKRWGRYWGGGPSVATRLHKGDDAGCFDRALWAVRTFGGVLEHPEASAAWDWYGIMRPLRGGVVKSRRPRLDVLRRTGALRAPRAKSYLALRGWLRAAAPRVGVQRALRGPSGWGCPGGAPIQARALRNPGALPGPPPGHGAQRTEGRVRPPPHPGSGCTVWPGELSPSWDEQTCDPWGDDCMRWRGRILTGRLAHWCPDWDDLPIDETTLELGDPVWSDPDDGDMVRVLRVTPYTGKACRYCGFEGAGS